MEKERFYQNLQAVYELSLKMDEEIYLFAKKANEPSEEQNTLICFLQDNSLEVNENSLLALGKRIAFLKPDSFIEYLESLQYSKEKVQKVLDNSYDLAKEIHTSEFLWFLSEIKNNFLLPIFYVELLFGIFEVGLEMDSLHIAWKNKIIRQTNEELKNRFGSTQKIKEFLLKNDLFDKDENGKIADWCYSGLAKTKKGYKKQAYSTLMPKEISRVVYTLRCVKSSLSNYKDEIFHQEDAYQDYLQSLIDALKEKDPDKLFGLWTQVDRDWMKIQGPIQICHLFEYYDDHYRNAVGIQWDVRLDNPLPKENTRKEKVNQMCDWIIFNKLDDVDCELYDQFMFNLEHASLHLGKPLMYFGENFNGLFSAQVIPNNEEVATEKGKKIFAFPDMILTRERIQPRTKLPKEVFSKKLLKKIDDLVYEKTQAWHDCYEVDTIGHEFSHILFVGNDTEKQMNVSGEYKNLEEFKATAGGIMSFLLTENTQLREDLIVKMISRSFSTIPWMDRNDRIPYYMEGIFNLIPLYGSGLISFENEKIQFNWNAQNYCNFCHLYESMYLQIMKHYFAKKDSKKFIEKYMCLEDGKWFPKNSDLKYFIRWYHRKYKKFGNMPE